MLRTCWLHKLRSPEVTAYLSSGDVILVPVGATEQHGPHLPLSVDTDWAVAACEGAAELSGGSCRTAYPLWMVTSSYGLCGYRVSPLAQIRFVKLYLMSAHP